uniref:Uncharacterized protein n=1 Tax=Glossina pallidipes TaxID=7398 RepID=A0A1B0A7K2_GLOPL
MEKIAAEWVTCNLIFLLNIILLKRANISSGHGYVTHLNSYYRKTEIQLKVLCFFRNARGSEGPPSNWILYVMIAVDSSQFLNLPQTSTKTAPFRNYRLYKAILASFKVVETIATKPNCAA